MRDLTRDRGELQVGTGVPVLAFLGAGPAEVDADDWKAAAKAELAVETGLVVAATEAGLVVAAESMGHALVAVRAFAKSLQEALQFQPSGYYAIPRQLVHTSELPPVDFGHKSIVTRHDGGSRRPKAVRRLQARPVMSCGALWETLRV